MDFWVAGNTPFSAEQMRRRIKCSVAGQTIVFVSPEDLILVKLLWHQKGGSARQVHDIESIIAIQNKLDWRYLKQWATVQGTWGILEKLKKKK